MNLKVIQVKYFLTWCIINLRNSSDTIKTKSLAGLKMDNKWQKLHKDRNIYRVFRHLLKTICCLRLQKKTSPVGKRGVMIGLLASISLQWAGWSWVLGWWTAFDMVNMITGVFQSKGHTSTYPKGQPENVQKASELLKKLLSFEPI